MYFPEDVYRASAYLSPKERQAFLVAVLEYYWDGVEPGFEGAARATFETVRDRLDLSKKRQAAGREGGKQTPSKRQANAKQNASKREAKPDIASVLPGGGGEGEGEGEEEAHINKGRLYGLLGNGIVESVESSPAAQLNGHDLQYSKPTPQEVENFLGACGMQAIDGERFISWHDEHGWPVHGWHQRAMSWSRREGR